MGYHNDDETRVAAFEHEETPVAGVCLCSMPFYISQVYHHEKARAFRLTQIPPERVLTGVQGVRSMVCVKLEVCCTFTWRY